MDDRNGDSHQCPHKRKQDFYDQGSAVQTKHRTTSVTHETPLCFVVSNAPKAVGEPSLLPFSVSVVRAYDDHILNAHQNLGRANTEHDGQHKNANVSPDGCSAIQDDLCSTQEQEKRSADESNGKAEDPCVLQRTWKHCAGSYESIPRKDQKRCQQRRRPD
jgi:hypothetical protein